MESLGIPGIPNPHVILSSAGLVYATYGPRLLRSGYGHRLQHEGSFRRAFARIYENFIQVVDCLAFGEEIEPMTKEK